MKEDRKIGCFKPARRHNARGYKVVQVYAYNEGGRIVGSDRGDGKSLWVSETRLHNLVGYDMEVY